MRITGIKHLFTMAVLTIATPLTSVAIPDPDDDGNSSPWIAQYFVSSSFAKVGKPVPVQWQSFFTVGCIIWTNQTGSRVVGTSGTTSVTPVSATTMSVRLSCAGTNGRTTQQTRSFSVNRIDHPELNSLSVTQGSVDAGTLVTLSWTSSFSNFCELSGTNSETLPANGSRSFAIRQGTNTFTVKCKSNDGRTSNTLIKTVTGRSPFPSINNFYISVPPGLQYHAIWFANAEFCTLDGFNVGSSGSRAYFKSTIPVTHRLTCFKNGYSTGSSATFRPSSNGGGGGGPILQSDDDGNQY